MKVDSADAFPSQSPVVDASAAGLSLICFATTNFEVEKS